ncbi:radial spoke head 1 homolog isoform X2 [Chelonus insularis]|uniref:radial spoke head 1 homolog isoform X2 n=1 Tax=Chelonus insularis TaxID=460826 RepID=UPI00158ED7A9|nr:radial spoke head 1 homolog isoform X2 [Chelonus insularis]
MRNSVDEEDFKGEYEEEKHHLDLKYKGEVNEKGERHGFGGSHFPIGDIYVGNYRQGCRHEHGEYTFKNGAKYEGHWQYGKKHGRGIFWYPDNSYYGGEWENDLKHGFGVYHYPNKDIYLGSWKNNLRHGLGTYEFNNSRIKFIGNWVEDEMMGPGQWVYPNYRFYCSWYKNQPLGRGCFVFDNNCMQHGYVKHIENSGSEVNSEDETATEDNLDSKTALEWKKISLKLKAQLITPYNPDLLPSEPVPHFNEKVNLNFYCIQVNNFLYPTFNAIYHLNYKRWRYRKGIR